MDISKIKLENVSYNIKDSVSRSDISSLSATLNTEIGRIENIIDNEKIKYLKNFQGKVCYFGDSYSNEETCPVNWCDELTSMLGLTSEDVFLSSRWNGSGFIGGGGAPTWGSQIVSIVNQTTQEERNQVSAIIIGGGFNDRNSSSSSIYSAMEAFDENVKLYFPNAMVYLAFIGWTVDVTTTDNRITGGYQFNLQKVLPVYSNCGKFGWKFLENCQYVMHDFSYFQVDKVHPNSDGSIAIASAMYSAINGNTGVYKDWITINSSNMENYVSSIAGGSPFMNLNNNSISIFTGVQNTQIAFTTNKTLTRGVFIPLFSIVDGYVMPDEYRPYMFNTIIYTKSDYSKFIYGQICLQNGKYGFIPLEDETTDYIIIPKQELILTAIQG